MNKLNRSKNNSNFQGTGVAIVTPFKENGDVDYSSLQRLLQNVCLADVDMLILFGTTGEAPTIFANERKDVIKFVTSYTKDYPCSVILGCSGNNTALLCQQIENTDFTHIHGILSSAPYYNKPTQEGIYQHYAAIAKYSPVPIIVYNIPSRTGVDILPTTLARLRHDFPEQIVATKDSSGIPLRVKEIMQLVDQNFVILSGDDCHTLEMIQYGAKGVISVIANAFPRSVKKLVDFAMDHSTESLLKAQNIDNTLLPFYKLLFIDGNPAGIKSLLKILLTIECSKLRLPLVEARNSTIDALKKELEYFQSIIKD